MGYERFGESRVNAVIGLAAAGDNGKAGDSGEGDAIERLLSASGLPLDGFRECLPNTLVARDGANIIGAAALEIYRTDVLLRSVVVDARYRGTGVGEALVEEAFVLARSKGATAAYLLTTTAADFFVRFGFEPIDRDRVPAAVQGSIEFTAA